MSSWFGNGISQITGQISTFTKEVLTEGTEEIDDHATQLKLARNQLLELESVCTSQKLEIERITKNNADLDEKLESSELQVNAISSEYRSIIQQKETEIQQLQHHQHALLEGEQNSHFGNTESSTRLDYQHTDLQRNEQFTHSSHSVNQEGNSELPDLTKLQQQIQALETQLISEKDSHQAELAALQDVHAQKISILKKRHKEEIKKYKEELEEHNQHLQDGASTASSDSNHIKELQGKVRQLEEINLKESTDLQHLHAANKQSSEELYTCQKQLKELGEQYEKEKKDKAELQTQQQSLLDNLDAITKDNQTLKIHLTDFTKKTNTPQTFEASTPIGKGWGRWKNEDVGDGTDDSIVSDFAQQSERIDSQVITLQQQVENYEREIEHFEMVKSDWLMEKEALEEVLLKLRDQMRDKEEALSIAQAQQGVKATPADVQPQGQGLIALGKHHMQSSQHMERGEEPEQGIEEDIDDLNHQVDLLTRGSARLENEHDILVIEKDSLLLEVQGEKEKVYNLQSQLEQATEDKNEVEKSIASLKAEMNKVQSELLSNQSQLQEKHQEIVNLQKENAEKIEELTAKELEHSKLLEQSSNQGDSQEMNVVKEQLEQTKAKLAEVWSERDSVMESLEELDTQHQQAMQQVIDSRDVLQKKHADLEKQLQVQMSKESDEKNQQQIEYDLKEAHDKINTLVKELKECEEKIKELEVESSRNEAKVKGALEENERLNEMLKMKTDDEGSKLQLESELKSVNEKYATTKNELDSISSEKDLLSSEVKLQKENLNALISEKQQLTLQLEKIKEEKDEIMLELKQLKNQIDTSKFEWENKLQTKIEEVNEEWEEKLAGDRSAMMAVRESVERELSSTEQELKDKVRHYENYISELEKSRELDTSELQSEYERVMKIGHEKDGEISKLESKLQQVQSDVEYNKDMLQDTIDGQTHITNLLADKDSEIETLRSENRTLIDTNEEQENVIKQHEAELDRLSHTEKMYKQLTEETKKLKVDMDELKKQLREKETEDESKQIESKTLGIITDLEEEITSLQETIDSKEETISQLQSQNSDLGKAVEEKDSFVETCKKENKNVTDELSSTQNIIGQLTESNDELKLNVQQKTDVIKNQENLIETLKQSMSTQESALRESNIKIDEMSGQLKSSVLSNNTDSNFHASVTKEKDELILNNSDSGQNYNGTANGYNDDKDQLIQIENLKKQIEERDSTIGILKDKNTSLNNLHEERSMTLHSDATLVDINRLESEVRSLRMEKEQMMQVLNDKTRECSQLKGEVHKLMNVVSAEKAALSKLQQDNQNLKEQEQEPETVNDDMGKDAIKQLSRMIRDKDLEIESLGQKNTTLLQVLQDSSQEGSQISGLIQERDNLMKQVTMFQNDREQIVAALNAKHNEAVSYHTEIQRLSALMREENQKQDLLQQEHSSLLTQYQEGKQTLVSAQQDYTSLMAEYQEKNKALMILQQELMSCKKRYAEIDNKYKEMFEEKLLSRDHSPPRTKEDTEKQPLMETTLEKEFKDIVLTASKSIQTEGYIPPLLCEKTDTVELGSTPSLFDSGNTSPAPSPDPTQQQTCDHLDELQNLKAIIKMHEDAFEEKDKVIMDKDMHLVAKDNLIVERDKLLDDKDKQYSELSTRFHKTEQMLRTRDSEIGSIKKQKETLTFQLKGIETEVVDLRQEKETLSDRKGALEQQMEMVKEANNKLSMALKDHAFELNALKEKNNTLTRLMQEKRTDQSEKGEMDRLMKETETLQHQAKVFKIDADQFAMALQQQQEENRDLKTQLQKVSEREQKLTREVERLRNHLMQVEEGYTRELLEAEEREKDLRNRLAAAEERALSASSSVDRTNLHASKQVEGLHQQLQELVHQRDNAILQYNAIHEQATQYASQLANLQMVLEQFQQEKEQQQAAEIEHYLKEVAILKQTKQQLSHTLHQTQLELDECKEALEAAQRLSEQLDKKEEMISALREEVQVRERQLNEAEDQITALTTAHEARIDKALAKNLILGYFHTPAGHKKEVIQVLASTLDFTHDELQQMQGESSSGGWLSGIFKKSSPTPPATPKKPFPSKPFASAVSIDKSFSELFVTFLEKESTPQPQFRLPAEEMAKEQQEKHRKPAFNPFSAPVPSSSFATSIPSAAELSAAYQGRSGRDGLSGAGGGSGASNSVAPLSISVPPMSSPSSLYGNSRYSTDSTLQQQSTSHLLTSVSQQQQQTSHLLTMAPISSSLPLFTATPDTSSNNTRDSPKPPNSAVLQHVLKQ